MSIVTCSIEGCERERGTRGWCGTHYARWLTKGDTFPHEEIFPSAETRFPERVRVMPSGCHEWQGGKLRGGYGSFKLADGMWQAHRWAWTQANGPIPEGLVVRHKCDNPPCVNVEHLELGTKSDNSWDMSKRGRSLIGSKTPIAKLTEAQVLEMKIALRDKTAKQRDLAVFYGISIAQVSRINKGHQWKHVTVEAA